MFPPEKQEAFHFPDVRENYLWEGLQVPIRTRVTANDVLFSGHTMTFTLGMLLWFEYLFSLMDFLFEKRGRYGRHDQEDAPDYNRYSLGGATPT